MAVFRSSPETFTVEEIPAYLPQGSGEHTFVWIEKRDLTTNEAVTRLARALDIAPRDVGLAGQKDRHATTWQWLSLPRVEPARALAASQPGLVVHAAVPHGNKLRLGHLKGNRFRVVLEDVSAEDAETIKDTFATLTAQGLPNRFGAQRFGMRGDNVTVALALLRGERRERDARRRRFLYSALQSDVFNRVLERRLAAGLLHRVLAGDVLQKTASGGLFTSADVFTDQARLDAGELVITGPLPGTRSMAPPVDSPAAALEDEAAAAVGLSAADLEAAGRDMPGARRPLLVPVGEAAVEDGDPGRLGLRFTLPAGCYATVLVGALGVTIASARRDEGSAPAAGPW